MNNYKKEISIVLVSYKSKIKISNLIKKISNEIKIIIIENSDDKTIKKIKRKNTLIIFSKNNGYGSAINLARRFIKTKYFFVFNPDVKKINNKLIKNFYLAAKKLNNSFGALGPRFIGINDESDEQLKKLYKYEKIETISGAAMFFKTKLFDFVGGFDKNFFLYFEENDYCYRAKKKGLNIYRINSEKIYHQIGTSVNIETREEAKKIKNLLIWHFIWSKFYFSKKKRGYLISLILFIPILIRCVLKLIFFKIIKKKDRKEHYYNRLNGLISSIIGKKSFKRI